MIQRVAAGGGAPAPVTSLGGRQEITHRFPSFLPDGKSFLFTIESSLPNEQGVYVASLQAPWQRVRLAAGWAKALYAPPREGYPGYLLWLREHSLIAQRYDGKQRVEGAPIPVADQILSRESNNGRAAFWLADNGLLFYRTGGSVANQFQWVSRDGKRDVIQVTMGNGDTPPLDPRLSPDGTRMALDRESAPIGNATSDVWVYEFARAVLTRLTAGPGSNSNPIWSPDGRQVAFRSDREGTAQIYRKDSAGASPDERLTNGPNPKRPLDWSRDGRYLLYEEQDPKTGSDIWALPLQTGNAADRQPISVLRSTFDETNAQFSPDAKWIAYTSNETGRAQVYIQSFPPATGKWQVSNVMGEQPKWRGDGKELYFYNTGAGDGSIWAAGIRALAGRVEIDPPRELPIQYVRYSAAIHYDVTPDGQRFLMIQPPFAGEDSGSILNVVSNWQAGLRQ